MTAHTCGGADFTGVESVGNKLEVVLSHLELLCGRESCNSAKYVKPHRLELQ